MFKQISFIICCCWVIASNAQTGRFFAENLEIGFGGIVSGDNDIEGNPYLDFYLLNSHLSIKSSKNTRIGYRNYAILQKPPTQQKTTFLIHGGYFQWDYYRYKGLILWAETGAYIGDFCPCGKLYAAVERPNTSFVQLGLGSSIHLFRGFSLEISGRHGFYVPKLDMVSIGDIGIFAHIGLIYQMRLRKGHE